MDAAPAAKLQNRHLHRKNQQTSLRPHTEQLSDGGSTEDAGVPHLEGGGEWDLGL